MASEVSLQDQPTQPAVAIRTKIPDDGVGGLVGELIGEVWGFLEAKGVHPTGGPYARTIYMPGTDIEVGFIVEHPLAGEGRVISSELPGGRAAIATHIGPYDQLGPVHKAVLTWVAEHNLQPAGAPWELYLSDPAREPDPKNWRTDVVLPVR